MSDVNLDFIVSNNNINFTVAPNDITFTPSDIQLSFYNGGLGVPGGTFGQLQYNNDGLLGGVANTSFSGSVLSLGSPNNISITGGSANYSLQTDGAGNLSWGQVTDAITANYANYAGIAFNVDGNVGNMNITGGTNGQYLQTDGTGNLAWVSGGGSGNGVVGGTNTQIQFNDAGSFGGNSGFTFNKTTGDVLISNSVAAPIVKLTFGTENVSLIGAQTGIYNFDLYSNAINFTTANATGNLTLNFRGNSTISLNTILANGQSTTGTYVMKTGTTTYSISNVQVDGSAQTIQWATGTPPFSFANSLMSFTFTIIKTSTSPTYTVLGSGTRYA
jgi:hypothetical protein